MVLCYLEGLTYEAAAQRLGLSEITLRGRLARARERLRRGLFRRGVAVPVGLLVAGATTRVQAAIPAYLTTSTTRISLGYVAGNSATMLARGVLNAMLLNQLKVVTALLVVGIGCSFWAWHGVAGAIADTARAGRNELAGKRPIPAPDIAPKAQLTPHTVTYRLSGTVRVEGTGEPVAGAMLQIHVGDVYDHPSVNQRSVTSGADGRFAVELPAGPAQILHVEPPVGYYWAPSAARPIASFYVGPDEPVIHREYRVRKGTIWDFGVHSRHRT